ncbi:MAG: hypothetical protein E7376_04310 [Clostridiales bacterium]|nr:hypothetical protein [Clostridiales bacterium]
MAKSKVKRGFLFYLIMFLAFVLGIFCILAVVLIFNPGEDIYGINLRYVSYKNAKEIYRYTDNDIRISDTTYTTVEFNSGFTNFNIKYDSSESNALVYFSPMVNALSRSENIDFTVSVTLVGETLKIDVTEPELWIGFGMSATVTMVCPKNKNFADKTFNITTETGSIAFGDTTNNNHSVKEIFAKSKSGEITVNKNVSITTGNATIETENSTINYYNENTSDLNITNVNGRINITKTNGNLHILNTGTLEANCGTIEGNILLESTKGYININELGTTEENGNFTTVNNCQLTNITIKKMYGNAIVDLTDGFVVIEEIAKRATIETTNGTVEIKKANDNVNISTQNGAVTLYQNSEAAITSVVTKKGKITSYFAQIGTVSLSTENSDIEINVVTGQPFKLIYETKDGITASWSTSTLEKNGTLLVSGATESTTNVIEALATNGKINVKEGYKVA